MIISQGKNEENDLTEKFDGDFFDFIAEYELLFGNLDLVFEDKDIVHDYIQTIKTIIADSE